MLKVTNTCGRYFDMTLKRYEPKKENYSAFGGASSGLYSPARGGFATFTPAYRLLSDQFTTAIVLLICVAKSLDDVDTDREM